MARILMSGALYLCCVSSPATAETPNQFLLSLPVGYGDARKSEICSRAAGYDNAGCSISTIIDPTSGTIVNMTVLQSIGNLEELTEAFSGDFVPWPWSRQRDETTFSIDDFVNHKSLPVILNPCSAIFCSEGTVCTWNSEAPWGNAICVPQSDKDPIETKVPFGWMNLPLGNLTQIFPLVTSGQDNPETAEVIPGQVRSRDDSLCGPLGPEKMCMGDYIKDKNGTIWQIP